MSGSTTNRLLLSLSPELRNSVISRSHWMDLPLKYSLFEAERTPDYAYFMTSGMASIVTEMEDGGTAEVGIIGEEVRGNCRRYSHPWTGQGVDHRVHPTGRHGAEDTPE